MKKCCFFKSSSVPRWVSTMFEYSDGTKVSIASMGFLRGTVVDRDNDIDETGRMVWPGSRVLGTT